MNTSFCLISNLPRCIILLIQSNYARVCINTLISAEAYFIEKYCARGISVSICIYKGAIFLAWSFHYFSFLATARLLNEGGTITGVIDQAVTIRCQFEVDSINGKCQFSTLFLVFAALGFSCWKKHCRRPSYLNSSF